MSAIDYAKMIFGGIYKVRQHLVKELQEEREKARIEPRELDKAIGLGPGWSKISKMEEQPQLLRYPFLKKMPACYLGIMGVEIQEIIEEYFKKNQYERMIAERDFINSSPEMHVTIDLRIQARNNYLKRPLARKYINSTPANVYVRMYVFVCILEQMKEMDTARPKHHQ
ncbi:MAG TPA: hypothetical protein VMR73_01920 [Candidatus Paceibacterota bacterium]|nr:hypothetical protein [Candidatus Paceibacterota bacterium]